MHRSMVVMPLALLACIALGGCKGVKPAADIRMDKDAAGQVTSMTLVGRNVTDGDVKEATKHTQISELRFQECSQVTKKGLSALNGSFPQLKLLDLVRVPIDDSSLEDLAKSATLTDLTLAHTQVVGSGLKHLTNCPLKRLAIFSRTVSAQGMKNLAALQSLEKLELHCQDLPLKDWVAIQDLKNLKKLVAFRTPVGPQGIDALKGMTQLQWLHLNSTDIQDESIDTLNSLTGLEWLEIDYATLTNAGLKRLQLPRLKQLSLDGCKGITDDGLANFESMPALEMLMLGGTGVAGVDLTPLANLPNLKEVRLMGNQFRGNDQSIQALKAKLPNCEVVIMRG